MNRYEGLEIEYQIASVFSIGMMISSYEFELEKDEYYEIIINALNNINITPDKVNDLPALIFMLPSFMTDETAPMVT